LSRNLRPVWSGFVVLASVLALSACGSSSKSSSSSGSSSSSSSAGGGASNTGAINIVEGTAPDSLDPGFGYTTQAAEADWIAEACARYLREHRPVRIQEVRVA